MRFFARLITVLFLVGIGFALVLVLFGGHRGTYLNQLRQQAETALRLAPQITPADNPNSQ